MPVEENFFCWPQLRLESSDPGLAVLFAVVSLQKTLAFFSEPFSHEDKMSRPKTLAV
jgi:hypothetical protein